MKNLLRLQSLFFIAFLFLISSNLFPQTSNYKVIGKINIGGEGGWDYLTVEPVMNRLYVSHATKIQIIDLNKNEMIGEIGDQHGVHGIAAVPEFGVGFISNGKDSSVTVFDLNTLKVKSSLKIQGKNPDAIIYDPFSKRVFVFNNKSANATAIDVATAKVIGNIALSGAPEFAVSDLNGKMYVNLEDKNSIEAFDPKNLKVISNWSIKPCDEPSGLAIDRENKKLFSVGRNKMMAIVDITTGKVIATPAIGSGVDGCAFDSGNHLAFSSNGEGSVTVIKEVSATEFKPIDTVPTQKGARTITVDEKTHRVFSIANIEETGKPKSFGVIILGQK